MIKDKLQHSTERTHDYLENQCNVHSLYIAIGLIYDLGEHIGEVQNTALVFAKTSTCFASGMATICVRQRKTFV